MISFNVVQTHRCILSAQRKCLTKMEEKHKQIAEKQREKLLQTETNIGAAALIHFHSYSAIYEDGSTQTPGQREEWVYSQVIQSTRRTEKSLSGVIQETAKHLEEVCRTARHKYILPTLVELPKVLFVSNCVVIATEITGKVGKNWQMCFSFHGDIVDSVLQWRDDRLVSVTMATKTTKSRL